MTCRNRADGKSFSCALCSKAFPTKRHLNEHSKRKHAAADGDDDELAKKPEEGQQGRQHAEPHQAAAPVAATPRLPSILPQIKEERGRLPQHLGYGGEEEFHGSHLQSPLSFYPHPLAAPHHLSPPPPHYSATPSVVTGCDLTLPQVEETPPPPPPPEEENVGSLMRLVYSCGAESSGASPSPSTASSSSSSSSSSAASVDGRTHCYPERMPVGGGHHDPLQHNPHLHHPPAPHHHQAQQPLYQQHLHHLQHHHHQGDKMSGHGEQHLVDYPILEGLPPIDCL